MCFRAVLFRMVPKRRLFGFGASGVLELCCFEWFQNEAHGKAQNRRVLELCCFEWFQNLLTPSAISDFVLELCCFEWFQN